MLPSSIKEALYQLESSFEELDEYEYLEFLVDMPMEIGCYTVHLNRGSNFRYIGKKNFDTYQGVKLK